MEVRETELGRRDLQCIILSDHEWFGPPGDTHKGPGSEFTPVSRYLTSEPGRYCSGEKSPTSGPGFV